MKKFVGMNAENALKTKPRDYDADHKDIALLRLKNFTIGRKLRDEEVVGEGGLERVVELIGCLVPFVSQASIFMLCMGLPSTLCIWRCVTPLQDLSPHRGLRLDFKEQAC